MLARSRMDPLWRGPARAVLAMPLAFSIANGLALGFITFPLVKLVAGRSRK